MTDEQLLGELKKGNLLDEESVAKMRREVLLSGRSVEELIYSRRMVDGVKIAQVKSNFLKVPLKKVDLDKIDEEILKLIPEETARTYNVVPISQKEDLLVVGMLRPDDPKAQEALKFIARRGRLNLGVYLISYDDWQDVLKKYSPYQGEIESAVSSLNLKSGKDKRVVSLEENAAAGDEAPIIRIVADTLKEAVQKKASDVHIEPQENYLRVRFRIDGNLKEAASLPLEISPLVISRVKVVARLKIDENRIPQDGRFRSNIFNREIDFRVSTFPTPQGEKVAIRILDQSVGLKTFDQLGLSGHNLEVVKKGLQKPFGMILVTGPTGSGKSTTLYALLQSLNNEKINIVSLEDPVEYFISGINQSQVRPEIGYTFASGLRQILRQDPDVIMVGEIRDNETGSLAVHAALTGHIVLSTLHTNNALGIIPRLVDMKVEPFLLPSALNILVGQRLVSQLCPDCKKSEDAPASAAKIIKETLAVHQITKYKEPYQIYRAEGCSKCNNTGFVGRIAIFEVFEMTKELAEIINTSLSMEKVAAESKRQGMVTMRQDGVVKALEGLITIEEVIRETEEM